MPQEHQRVRSLANTQPSVTRSAIETGQSPFVSGWSSVSPYESALKYHTEVHHIGVAMEGGARSHVNRRGSEASRSALDLPGNSENDRLNTAGFRSKITEFKTTSSKPTSLKIISSKIISSKTVSSKTASSKKASPVEDLLQYDDPRRSGDTGAISGIVTKKNSALKSLPDRHSKQGDFASPHEYLIPISESTQRLNRHQVDRPGSPSREYHPDLEQPPRERSMTDRHAKASSCAALIPLARSITPEVRPFSKSCPTFRSQDHVATLDYRGELRDAILEERHQPVANKTNCDLPNGVPKSQSSHRSPHRHGGYVNTTPGVYDTRVCIPPLVDTDRHHTEPTVRHDNLDSAATNCAKDDLPVKPMAGHRHGGGCMDPDKPGSGDGTDDDDDDDGQIGFREFQKRPRHRRSASYTGHASKARVREYNKAVNFPNPRRWQPRRRGSQPGVLEYHC